MRYTGRICRSGIECGGEEMGRDGLLPYEFEEEPGNGEVTGHAGLTPYIDLTCVLGVLKASDEKISGVSITVLTRPGGGQWYLRTS